MKTMRFLKQKCNNIFSNEKNLQRDMFTVIVVSFFFTATRQSAHLLSKFKNFKDLKGGSAISKNK